MHIEIQVVPKRVPHQPQGLVNPSRPHTSAAAMTAEEVLSVCLSTEHLITNRTTPLPCEGQTVSNPDKSLPAANLDLHI
jgi:hypothetical protein